MKQPYFNYEAEHAVCIATDDMGREFKGEAWCAKDDLDFESELTGYTIAEYRAQIAAAKTYRNDLRIKLSALKQLYYSMKHSSHFNPKSYEAKMLFKQMKRTQEDLDIAIHQLAVLKVELYEFIQDKETFYQKLRKARNDRVSNDK